MDNMKSFLDGFEKLVYDILSWLIMVPKTLAKVVSNPSWVPSYVAQEFAEKDSTRFDDYMSPVILMLLTSLVPFAILDALPEPGVGVVGPVSGVVDKDYVFEANADFIYPSTEQYTFTLNEYVLPVDEKNPEVDYTEVIEIDAGSDVGDKPSAWFGLRWSAEGQFRVDLIAKNDRDEEYSASHNIEIRKAGAVVDDSPKTLDDRATGGLEKMQETLQGEAGIVAALIFMGLPLLFALSIEIFRGHEITSTALKRSFYAQCYYFAPLYLSMWAFIVFVVHFNVEGVNDTLSYLVFLLFVIMFVWFFVNEIRTISRERAIGKIKATFVFLLCIVISLIALVLSVDSSLAFFLWWAYLIAALMVFITGVFFKKTKNRQVGDATE